VLADRKEQVRGHEGLGTEVDFQANMHGFIHNAFYCEKLLVARNWDWRGVVALLAAEE